MTNNISTRAKWLVAIALAVATLAVYWELGHHSFVDYDDNLYVTDNRQVAAGLSWSSIAWAFKTTIHGNWIPLAWLTHILDFQLYGLKAGGHHISSLVVHLINSILLFFMLNRLTGALWKSAIVAALFALHPINVESVAWIAERKNVLCTLFWILGIWAYGWYSARPGWKRYLVVLSLFALGLMSKSMVVTLPFVLLLLDYWPLGRLAVNEDQSVSTGESDSLSEGRAPRSGSGVPWRLLIEKVPFLLLAGAAGIVTMRAQVEAGSLITFPLGLRIQNAVVSYVMYLEKTVWPSGLAVLYPHPRSYLPWLRVGIAGAILACLTAAAILGARRFKYLGVGWLWFLGTLVPVIGIIKVGAQSMADRYAYIPLIGIFIMVVWGISDLVEHRRKARDYVIVSAVCVIFAFVIVTRVQLSYWTNSIVLWRHTLAVTENNYIACNNMGEALWSQGMMNEAAAWFYKSLEIYPDFADGQENLGMVLIQSGELDDGIAHLTRAMELDPQSVEAYNKLGGALARKGRTDDAIRCLETGLRIDPQYAPALGTLGVIFEGQGNLEQASDCFEKGTRAAFEPGLAMQLHFAYGNILVKKGELPRAAREYREALKLKPDFQPASDALNQIQGGGG